MTFTASDVLLKAASRIEEEGMWCQGRFFADVEVESVQAAWNLRQQFDERTAECAMGALISAAVELGLSEIDYYRAQDLLFKELCRQPNAEWISGWNDTPGRTAAEVAETMRRAAL